MYKKLPPIILFLILYFTINCQNNLHFTQFYHAPLISNPAQTGNFDDLYRVTGVIRMQYDKFSGDGQKDYLYDTKTIAGDLSMFDNKLGVGLYVLQDNIESGIFKTTRGGFSLAYHSILGDNRLSFGAQGIYTQTEVDPKGLSWIQTPEPLGNVTYFDMSAGINYRHQFSAFETDFGISCTHLLQPTESFIKNSANKSKVSYYFRTYINFVDWELYDEISIFPGLHVGYQNKTTDILFGSNASFKFLEIYGVQSKFYAGLWGRSNRLNVESAVGLIGLGFNKIKIMLSYDYNLNINKNYLNRTNSIELGLILTGKPTIVPPLFEDNYLLNPRF